MPDSIVNVLPPEILCIVMKHLSQRDIFPLRLCCKDLYNISNTLISSLQLNVDRLYNRGITSGEVIELTKSLPSLSSVTLLTQLKYKYSNETFILNSQIKLSLQIMNKVSPTVDFFCEENYNDNVWRKVVFTWNKA
jgi:hypothetical protein